MEWVIELVLVVSFEFVGTKDCGRW